jgi:alpha-tubulin suppressor-like RCC1 family protein
MKPFLLIQIVVGLSCLQTSLIAGQIWAWGDNTYGQLNVPANLTNAIAVSAGQRHCVALRADGTPIAWGDNSSGQTNVPPGLTNVVAVDAGVLCSLALKADGSVVGWGYNGDGQLNIPVGLKGVIAVSTGEAHSLALKSDGTVVAWGSYQGTNVPANLSNVVALSAGVSLFSVALRANGTLTTWGYEDCGDVLRVPADLTNVVAVSAGYTHVLALLPNGTVRAFGCDFYGETDVPPDLTNAVAVSAGAYSSLALKSDGRVVAWGWNTNPPASLVTATSISAGKAPDPQPYNLALANVPQSKAFINFVGPLSQTVQAGSQAFFSVSASGAPPLRYQWYFGTNSLAGATNQHLVLNNVQASQAGTYTVTVTNVQGAVTSPPVTLNVTARVEIFMTPTISLTGGVGASFRIDYINALGPTNAWTTLATVTLTNAQQFYSDYSAIGQPSRVYRIVQVP